MNKSILDLSLEKILTLSSVHIYWLSRDNIYQGCNDMQAISAGLTSRFDIVGKKNRDLPWFKEHQDIADEVDKVNLEIMESGEPKFVEERAVLLNGKKAIFLSHKLPLREHAEGKVTGLMGISINISNQKEQEEKLRSEKEQIDYTLNYILGYLPAHIYWKDRNGVYLGCNDQQAKSLGFKAGSDLIGKTDYELPWGENKANIFRKNDLEVMQTGKTEISEEPAIFNGVPSLALSQKRPLKDKKGNIIGILGISIDITDRKELERARIENEQHVKFQKIIDQAANDTKSPITILLLLAQQCDGCNKEQIFEKLKTLTSSVPISLYWMDINSKIVGMNARSITNIGLATIEESIGKTPYDYYPREMADNIVKHNNEVMRSGKVLSQEEPIVEISSGKTKYFMSFKAPLYDEKGNIIGLVGTSVDITAEKIAKQLVLDKVRDKAIIAEHEKFSSVAKQFAHDITGALGALVSSTERYKEDIPEEGRYALMTAKTQIENVSYALLAEYSERNKAEYDARESRRPVLVYLTLLELLIEKRYQYKNQVIDFKDEFASNSKFAFIKVAPSAFKRMMSNLINNAVDAFDGKAGEVAVKLIVDEIQFKIIIQDNGKGIPENVLEKLKNNISVTHGKENGHGIGMTQIRDAIKDNNGEINIESEVGTGTKITLTFPTIPMPTWATNKISLHHDDTIVILDDDPSIHSAWDIRFKDYTGLVTLKHFTQGDEAIAFINTDIDKFKSDIVLLSDYELLKQKRNGLEIIEAAKVPRSILVTSHFADHKILDLVKKAHVKMLPKSLVGDVLIEIVGQIANTNVDSSEKIEIVIVEDNQLMADSLASLLKKCGKKTDVYYDAHVFLENFAKYSKNTKICLDYSLGEMNGIDIAKKLHEAGYTKIFLLTGWDRDSFGKNEKNALPDYLTMILKTDTDQIREELTSS